MASACSRIAASPAELPAALRPSRAGARLVGVAHPAGIRPMASVGPAMASIAAAHRSCGAPRRATSASAPANVRTFFAASAAVGVGHAARMAKSFRFEPWRVAPVPPVARLGCPPPLASLVCGVGQEASFAIHARSTWRLRPSGVFPVGDICPPFGMRPPFGQVGVGQYAASCATICRSVSDTPIRTPRATARRLRARNASGVPFACCASGVGHEPQPLPDVRRTDARSAKIDRPDGVTRSFQVSVNKVEPLKAVAACNLLAKHDARTALRDETEPDGPEMPLVRKSESASSRAEWLARTTARPDRPTVRPAGETQCARPRPDAGEEVALIIAGKFLRRDIANIPFIDIARRDQTRRDQVAQPLCRVRIALVVPGTHGLSSSGPGRERRSRCNGS